ncbi:MAG TPA: hypothetical protein PLW60_04885 [Bacilli bacterium]|nr:MAG: hypothetical protein BWY97_00660 [Tenericutes bacterium ADurb.BinA124]HNZ50256.1 hypothetical protein [Bacilli bacterium]HPO06303.1 hypothetical protein [Candidatus Gracilibacteria bacterium]HPX84115.1 hypothetical protein [Bacilli bacterium]HQC74842.1 hypothetical protein [Bacilli bacterium]
MNNKTELYFDFFDEIAMILVSELGLSYLEAFHKTKEIILEDDWELNLPHEEIVKITTLTKALNKETFTQEDIRLALQLLTVKAYQAMNQKLSLMTPDTVNYLFSRIINRKFSGQSLTILDINLGTSNLLQTVANHFPGDKELIGIELNPVLVQLAASWADLQNNELKIYWQDVMTPIHDLVDLEIGDLDDGIYEKTVPPSHPLATTKITYYPYLAISSQLANLKDQGYFIYLVNNDFFNQPGAQLFRNFLNNWATLLGLIVLPETMFQSEKQRKSILIGKKTILNAWDLLIFPIANLSKSQLPTLLAKLDQFTDKL